MPPSPPRSSPASVAASTSCSSTGPTTPRSSAAMPTPAFWPSAATSRPRLASSTGAPPNQARSAKHERRAPQMGRGAHVLPAEPLRNQRLANLASPLPPHHVRANKTGHARRSAGISARHPIRSPRIGGLGGQALAGEANALGEAPYPRHPPI